MMNAPLLQRSLRACTMMLAAAAVLVASPALGQFTPRQQVPAQPSLAPRAPMPAPAPAPAPAPLPQQQPEAAPAPGGDQLVTRIAAVVNDDIVSLSDIQGRTRLALFSSGLPDTPESRQRLAGTVLRTLIDESLQLQEAERAGISVSEREIEDALERIAQQNGTDRAGMERTFAERGVPLSALRAQVRAGVAWAKLVQRRLRPQVEIGDEEIDLLLDRLRANAGKPEYLVAEIFLAVDSPEQEPEVRALADRLFDQISGGTSFAAVARQFSQSAGAANGGDVGWVLPGQLPEEVDRQLREMRPGQLSRPVRSVAGFHILLVRDQRTVAVGDPREVRLSLKQVFVPRGADMDEAALRSRAAGLRSELAGCGAMDARAAEAADGVSGDLGTVKAGDLPPQIAEVVLGLPVGEPSPPLVGDRGALILMVCSRDVPKDADATALRDQIRESLGAQRLDMLQRRLLRDLRRAAFVDVRV
jgi:peptidyl-prolyl cis-trans isomerase SurA